MIPPKASVGVALVLIAIGGFLVVIESHMVIGVGLILAGSVLCHFGD